MPDAKKRTIKTEARMRSVVAKSQKSIVGSRRVAVDTRIRSSKAGRLQIKMSEGQKSNRKTKE